MPGDLDRPKKVSRKQFMATMGAAGAALPLSTYGVLAKHPPVKASKLPICIFSKHLQWLGYDEMAETAAEIGFDGVDLPVRPRGHVLPEHVERDLPRAVEAVRKAGLEVHMMTTRITDPAEPYAEPILKTARELGIGYYRMGYLRYNDELGIQDSLDVYRQQLQRLAELNRRYNIHGAYQNHSGTGVGGPVWDVWYLIKDLDPRWLGCQYDIRHAMVEGGRSWSLGMNLLQNHIKITAIKDFDWAKVDGQWKIRNVPLGEGMVDFKKYFSLVKEMGIEGPISLHYEYPLFDGPEQELSKSEKKKQVVPLMKKDVRTLRAMLTEAGLAS